MQKKTLNMITSLLELFKILPYVTVSIVPKPLSYSIEFRQSNSIKSAKSKLQQISEIYFHLNLCNIYVVMKVRSLITEMCNINL